MYFSLRASILSVCLLLLFIAEAVGQEVDTKLIPKNAEGVDDGKPAGWHPLLRFAGNAALGQSKNTPGTPDGVSLQLGYLINAAVDYLSTLKRNEWANTLDMALSYTRTPVVDAFVKSNDSIDFRSTYLYHPAGLPWLGPFVQFRLSAPMLKGYEVRADPTSVVRLKPGQDSVDENGAPIVDVTEYESEKKIPLTDPFAPMTLRESVGVFAIPLDKPWLKTDFRLGFGAWETFVQGGYVIEDNEDTADLLELRQMQDSVQLGPELGIILKGAHKEIIKYAASALFMQPVYQSVDTDLEGLELLNMEFQVGLGVKITKYFSIDYAFKAYKQPLIVDDWQIQNNLLLTLVFEVPAPAPPPPACPPCPEVAPAVPAEAPPAETSTEKKPATPLETEAPTASPDQNESTQIETTAEPSGDVETAPPEETDVATPDDNGEFKDKNPNEKDTSEDSAPEPQNTATP